MALVGKNGNNLKDLDYLVGMYAIRIQCRGEKIKGNKIKKAVQPSGKLH